MENCTFNSRQYKIVQYITPSNQPYLITQKGAPDTYNLIQSSWLLFSTCSRLSKPLEIQKTCSKEPKSLPKFKINIDKPKKHKNFLKTITTPEQKLKKLRRLQVALCLVPLSLKHFKEHLPPPVEKYHLEKVLIEGTVDFALGLRRV